MSETTGKEISEQDREFVRGKIEESGSHIQKIYGWSTQRIRRLLHEMIDVTV